MKKFIFVLVLILALQVMPCYSEAVQIDFLLAGMRDPITDEPLNGGLVKTYLAGTGTQVNLNTDRDQTASATWPIVLDAYGRAIVFGNGIYLFVVENASGTVIWSSDGLEYTPVVDGNTGAITLTQHLDTDGFKIINTSAGANPGDAIEFTQLGTLLTAIAVTVAAVQTNLEAWTFLDLVDTPISYSGYPNQVVTVGSSSTTLVFRDVNELVASATFALLPDTPMDYTGHAGDIVVVGSDAVSLDFKTIADYVASPTFEVLPDTPASYTGAALMPLRVNAGETGVEFYTPTASLPQVPIGTIMMYAGDSVTLPANWALCNGALITVGTTYTTLAANIGTTWGTGGLGQIRLPDLRGIFPKGVGTNDHTGLLDAAGNPYAGGSLGVYEEDSLQGHDHLGGMLYGSGVWYDNNVSGGQAQVGQTQGVTDEISGVYGPARPAVVTQPAAACVHYIIKVL